MSAEALSQQCLQSKHHLQWFGGLRSTSVTWQTGRVGKFSDYGSQTVADSILSTVFV